MDENNKRQAAFQSENDYQDSEFLRYIATLKADLQALDMKSQLAKYLTEYLAERAAELLVKRCIRKNQLMVPGLLTDSGVANLWDEICVMFQSDSELSEMYKHHLSEQLVSLASELPDLERLCLWLTTYWGECFLEAGEPQQFDPKTVPICDEHIAKHVLDGLLYEAFNYQNQRIRKLTGY